MVEELYERFVVDKNSVDPTWWPTLEKYAAKSGFTAPAAATPTAPAPTSASTGTETQPVATTTSRPAQAAPIPADAPVISQDFTAAESEEQDIVTVLKGMPKTLAANMDQSLTVPTATSVRAIPAKLLIDNRIVINNHLKRTRGGKVSFTHIIGWALVQALKAFPSQNVFYEETDGKP
ncbi:MAG: 2-oxo acid dehydrogenase subunit E2, partial [Aurantimicrobium sp.]